MRWWTWTQRSRTVATLPFDAIILDTSKPPLYQQIADKSLRLYQLGLSQRVIAEKLIVDEKTVSKAIRWINED